jgi:hypothetical protein
MNDEEQIRPKLLEQRTFRLADSGTEQELERMYPSSFLIEAELFLGGV